MLEDFKAALGSQFESVWEVFGVSLEINKQIRIANAMIDFFHRATEFVFLQKCLYHSLGEIGERAWWIVFVALEAA